VKTVLTEVLLKKTTQLCKLKKIWCLSASSQLWPMSKLLCHSVHI